eukprot:jgi/Mesvir1/3776/Mv08223-RA.1
MGATRGLAASCSLFVLLLLAGTSSSTIHDDVTAVSPPATGLTGRKLLTRAKMHHERARRRIDHWFAKHPIPEEILHPTHPPRHPPLDPLLVHDNYPLELGQGCPALCHKRGKCVNGKCVCAIAWSGSADCSAPRNLPCNTKATPFTGWVMNRETLRTDLGYYGERLCNLLGTAKGTPQCQRHRDNFLNIFRNGLEIPDFDPIIRMIGSTCALVGASEKLLTCNVTDEGSASGGSSSSSAGTSASSSSSATSDGFGSLSGSAAGSPDGSSHGSGRTIGDEIDAHDIVIRVNDAPTVGFEEHVGRRTTLRFQGAHRSLFREGNEYNLNLGFPFYYSAGGRNLLPYPEIVGASGLYGQMLGESNLHLSHGWHAIHAALHICSKLTIYGFSAEVDGEVTAENGFGHYYQKWFNGDDYANYLMEVLGHTSLVGHQDLVAERDLRKWWLPPSRREFTEKANEPRNIGLYKFSRNPKFGRQDHPAHLEEATKYGFTIKCNNPWVSHCLDEEARCAKKLPEMFAGQVKLKCSGAGISNGM